MPHIGLSAVRGGASSGSSQELHCRPARRTAAAALSQHKKDEREIGTSNIQFARIAVVRTHMAAATGRPRSRPHRLVISPGSPATCVSRTPPTDKRETGGGRGSQNQGATRDVSSKPAHSDGRGEWGRKSCLNVRPCPAVRLSCGPEPPQRQAAGWRTKKQDAKPFGKGAAKKFKNVSKSQR